MGEAKIRMERLRQTFLANAELWMFPRSTWEDETVRTILALPEERARRGYPSRVGAIRAPSRECHTNTAWYVEHDPSGRSKAVTGWWRQANVLVLHAVIDIDGELFCITPSDVDPSPEIRFIRDPALRWSEEGGRIVCRWNGHAIGPGLRIDPEQVMADTALIRDRLRSGMNPYEAVKIAIGSGHRTNRALNG